MSLLELKPTPPSCSQNDLQFSHRRGAK